MKSTRKRLKTLVIRESKWLRYRTNGKGGSKLRKAEGKMCCLGFLGLACGAAPKQLMDKGSPENTLKVKWPQGVRLKDGSDSEWTHNAIEINDHAYIHTMEDPDGDAPTTLEVRKKMLAKHFLKIGYKLVYVP